MKIHSYPEKYCFVRPVVTVGTFDGVHQGHREIIRKLKQIAQDVQGEAVVVTLWPHPRITLKKTENNFFLLNTLQERIKLLSSLEVDHLVVFPFSENYARLSYTQFIDNILIKNIGVHHLLLGTNNHYGNNKEGNTTSIAGYAAQKGIEVSQAPLVQIDGTKVSSTLIRNLLLEGKVEQATALLGQPYPLSGKVVPGDKLGTQLGFPTLNLEIPESGKLIPPDGVYAVTADEVIPSSSLKGMMYIGTRPSLKKEEKKRRIEVHLFNFTENLYGREVWINVIRRMREEMAFTTLEELKNQINKDKITILNFFQNNYEHINSYRKSPL